MFIALNVMQSRLIYDISSNQTNWRCAIERTVEILRRMAGVRKKLEKDQSKFGEYARHYAR